MATSAQVALTATDDEGLQSLFPNDEHKGMDMKQIEEHENATKLKTI